MFWFHFFRRKLHISASSKLTLGEGSPLELHVDISKMMNCGVAILKCNLNVNIVAVVNFGEILAKVIERNSPVCAIGP